MSPFKTARASLNRFAKGWIAVSVLSSWGYSESSPEKIAPPPCPTPPLARNYPKSDVYRGMPFQAGEKAKFLVSYMGVKAGYLEFEAREPQEQNGEWLMSFATRVITGDWYSGIYKADDEGHGLSHPFSFTAAQFYLKQDHRKLIGSNYAEEKELSYDRTKCEVTEVFSKNHGQKKTETFYWDPEAADILAAFFKIRTLNYQVGLERRFLVYTSEKNWWLSATPEALVKLKTSLGEQIAARINLQTFIGKELQQRGKMKLWIAFQHPQRPMVRIEAEVKVGSFIADLIEFRPGVLN